MLRASFSQAHKMADLHILFNENKVQNHLSVIN